MKHLAYSHRPLTPIVAETLSWIHQLLPRRLQGTGRAGGAPSWRGRLLCIIGWLLALVIQAALILVIKEVIELAHGVIGLYLDLAKLQLDLTSQYVSATSP